MTAVADEEDREDVPARRSAPARRLFSGEGRQTLGNAIRNARKTAGIASYSRA
jgi:hypothetical protein